MHSPGRVATNNHLLAVATNNLHPVVGTSSLREPTLLQQGNRLLREPNLRSEPSRLRLSRLRRLAVGAPPPLSTQPQRQRQRQS